MTLPSTPQSAQELANLIFNQVQKSTEKVSDRTFKRGVIVEVNANGTSDVEVEGSPVATENILSLASYSPKVGDKVLLLSIGNTGTNLLILGALVNRVGDTQVGTSAWQLYYTREGKRQWRTYGTASENSISANGYRTRDVWFPGGLPDEYYIDSTAGANVDVLTTNTFPDTFGRLRIFIKNNSANVVHTTVAWSITLTEK